MLMSYFPLHQPPSSAQSTDMGAEELAFVSSSFLSVKNRFKVQYCAAGTSDNKLNQVGLCTLRAFGSGGAGGRGCYSAFGQSESKTYGF